jgi:hypothetical protein
VAVNITVRDIVNFPGGTPKTVTVDIAQIVPVGGSPEGDEIWVTSTTTTATASGGGSIESIFKNDMKRGFIRSSGLVSGLIDVPASNGFKVAIDEVIGNGVSIELASGNNLLPEDVAQDIEDKIRAQAVIGGGGGKIGNLSYLNVQVRFVNSRFSIESGTVADTFTGTGRSSVVLDSPDGLSDVRALLGFDIETSSETLAARQIVESSLASDYTTGDLLELQSTAGFTAGDSIEVLDATNQQKVLVSGAGVSDGLTAAQVRFVTVSGVSLGLDNVYSTGSLVRKIHPLDVSDPVSAVATIDQVYRFAIDSIVNQIDFSA